VKQATAEIRSLIRQAALGGLIAGVGIGGRIFPIVDGILSPAWVSGLAVGCFVVGVAFGWNAWRKVYDLEESRARSL
jgi:hypothetical protein